MLAGAGHLPQVETPDALIGTIWAFADAHAARRPAHPSV
ncbi:hypothetical protein BC793_10796 [Actinoplanes xinjiangensis]|uniref:Alpha/beta hydrolase family protein n=1 Tax=Actinoplanes xinjiangensis TaxID=512350 RepID=A0A316FID2_9ACTN|nr:hypothetical protein BC793_10796 [Actinoplanes xinjiangensis]